MQLDVSDLRSFYYRTRLGRVAQSAIRDQVRRTWDEAKGQTVLGYGFAVPVLRPYLADARRVIALMPGRQGVSHWPNGKPNLSVLCEDTLWPLPTGLVDKMIMLHGLETSDNPGALLDEAHRVLGPGGRALFIVPSRSGLWARREHTPFGHGQPYSLAQIEGLLKRHRFTPERHRAALFGPPVDKRFWIRTSGFWERTGQKLSSALAGGVLLVEATKQVYAPRGSKVSDRLPNPLRALDAAPTGAKPALGRASALGRSGQAQ